eukprot:2136041-Pleurochrysis_carterae.AAC.1
MGKRVCESPPVPTVSGSSMRLSHEWMMPSPGRSETPARFMMKSAKAQRGRGGDLGGRNGAWESGCVRVD